MRILLLVALLPAAASAQSFLKPLSIKRPTCAKPSTRFIDTAPAAGTRKLNELPPAQHIATVYREVNGCPTPVVLRPTVR